MLFNKISFIRVFSQRIMPFYAVACGRKVGIFNTWPECEEQVKGFKGAKYKKFPSKADAEDFLRKFNIGEDSNTYKPENFAKPLGKPKTQLSHVLENCKSQTVVPDIPDKDNEKEILPSVYIDQENELTDEDLLLALTEVEGISGSVSSKKRLANGENHGGSIYKKRKYDSKVWQPIGIKHIRGFEFQIDEEGYVLAYTDGSCFNNGQKNACAGYGVYFGDDHPLNVGCPVTGRVTNNVGEIQAAIYAIKTVKDLGISKICISTDSQFLINSATLWIKGWKARNWRLKSGGHVKNATEFIELEELLQGNEVNVKWNYVKAHQGIKGNEMADKLARQGSEIYKRLQSREN